MTHGFGSLRRSAALSAAIALFASPIAAAQTAPTVLLSPAAFARLVQATQPAAAPGPVGKDPPRLSGLPHNPMAAAGRAEASRAQPPVRSRSVGQKIVVVLAVVGLFAGAMAVAYYTGADFGNVLDGLFGWAAK